MIAVCITDSAKKETEFLCLCTRDAVGMLSDETVKFEKCVTAEEFEEMTAAGERVDLACVDISLPQALPAAENFRGSNKDACLVLIATMKISPVTYMRPSIRAEGLILRPFRREQVKETMHEAVSCVLKRCESPDTDEMFVVENSSGRELVPYRSICFFEAYNKKICLNAGAKEYYFYDTMDRLEKELGGRFIRCHRGFLVNCEKIQRVQLSKNLLILEDEYEIPVSRTYKSVLREYGKKAKEAK